MITGSNIDPIRVEIMRLEGLQVFDQAGWERVLADLRAQGRECGLADAERRMRSAMGRQLVPSEINADCLGALRMVRVLDELGISVETEV